MIRSLALALAMTACSAAEERPATPLYGFDPSSPEAWTAFELASDKIERATGARPISVSGGIPITFEARPDDADSCARTITTWYKESLEVLSVRVVIFSDRIPGCFDDPSLTVTHELIHAVRDSRGLHLGIVEHSSAGVFTAKAGDERLEETSLSMLCEAFDCAIFNPER